MMATTHAFAALLVLSPVALLAPEYATVLFVAGFLGGIFPDLDIVFIVRWFEHSERFSHRRALHYPEIYSLIALFALITAVLVPTVPTIAVAAFLIGAALHSVMDMFGGGLESFPWEARSQKAVYRHYSGAWAVPRRVIPYDGAPEDLVMAAVIALPLVLAYPTPWDVLVTGLLGVSTIYAVLRKPLAHIAPDMFINDQFVEAA